MISSQGVTNRPVMRHFTGYDLEMMGIEHLEMFGILKWCISRDGLYLHKFESHKYINIHIRLAFSLLVSIKRVPLGCMIRETQFMEFH